MNPKEYIGDSVYAEFDGFGIWLTTENGLPGDPSNRIYLEPDVLDSLLVFKRSQSRDIGIEPLGTEGAKGSSMTHDLDGPSSAGRHVGCPGARELERRAIELNLEALEDKEDAESGTRLHEAIAYKKALPAGHPDAWIVDRCRKYEEEKLPAHGPHDPPWIEREITLPLFRNGEKITHGTLDFLYLDSSRIIVLDYKTGQLEPDEESLEWQMKLYAAMALQKWRDIAIENKWPLPEIGFNPLAEVYVYFPRLSIERTATFSDDYAIATQYACALDYAKVRPEEYHPTVSRCKYCKGKSICPAFKKEFTEALTVIPRKESLPDLPLEKVREIVEVWGPKVALASKVVEGARKHLRDNVPADVLASIGYEVVESQRKGFSVNPTTVRRLKKIGETDEPGERNTR